MTIASCLTRLAAAKDAIIAAINAKGVTATGHGFEDFATDIAAIQTGGGSSWTKIATKDFTVSTTSTTAAQTGTIVLGSQYFTSGKIICVKVRDKAGARSGYFVGSDSFFINPYPASGNQSSNLGAAGRLVFAYNNGSYSVNASGGSTGYGVYGNAITPAGDLTIYQRYNSSISRTINGTYEVTVWTLDYAPNQGNPFNYSYA